MYFMRMLYVLWRHAQLHSEELLNICHSYRITVDVNFNASKSFCVAFTLKLFKPRFPELNINAILIPYTDSIKYLGINFTNNHKDDSDMLRLMRMLYARSNRLVRLFHYCSRNVLIELSRSFCGSFYGSYLWTHYNNALFSQICVAYNELYRKIVQCACISSQ